MKKVLTFVNNSDIKTLHFKDSGVSAAKIILKIKFIYRRYLLKKKIYLGIAIAIILLFANNTVFAKYIYEHIIGGEIYIDRTFPIISVTIDKNTKNYHLTQNETIKTSKDFSISVNDNGEISLRSIFIILHRKILI